MGEIQKYILVNLAASGIFNPRAELAEPLYANPSHCRDTSSHHALSH